MVRTRIPEASLVGLLAALATFCALEARGGQPYSIVGQSGPATAATGRRPLAERIKAANRPIRIASEEELAPDQGLIPALQDPAAEVREWTPGPAVVEFPAGGPAAIAVDDPEESDEPGVMPPPESTAVAARPTTAEDDGLVGEASSIDSGATADATTPERSAEGSSLAAETSSPPGPLPQAPDQATRVAPPRRSSARVTPQRREALLDRLRTALAEVPRPLGLIPAPSRPKAASRQHSAPARSAIARQPVPATSLPEPLTAVPAATPTVAMSEEESAADATAAAPGGDESSEPRLTGVDEPSAEDLSATAGDEPNGESLTDVTSVAEITDGLTPSTEPAAAVVADAGTDAEPAATLATPEIAAATETGSATDDPGTKPTETGAEAPALPSPVAAVQGQPRRQVQHQRPRASHAPQPPMTPLDRLQARLENMPRALGLVPAPRPSMHANQAPRRRPQQAVPAPAVEPAPAVAPADAVAIDDTTASDVTASDVTASDVTTAPDVATSTDTETAGVEQEAGGDTGPTLTITTPPSEETSPAADERESVADSGGLEEVATAVSGADADGAADVTTELPADAPSLVANATGETSMPAPVAEPTPVGETAPATPAVRTPPRQPARRPSPPVTRRPIRDALETALANMPRPLGLLPQPEPAAPRRPVAGPSNGRAAPRALATKSIGTRPLDAESGNEPDVSRAIVAAPPTDAGADPDATTLTSGNDVAASSSPTASVDPLASDTAPVLENASEPATLPELADGGDASEAPAACIEVTVSGPEGTTPLGERVTLHLTVKNTGTAAATAVTPVVHFGVGLEPLGIRGRHGNFTTDGSVMFDRVAELAAGESVDVEIIAVCTGAGTIHYQGAAWCGDGEAREVVPSDASVEVAPAAVAAEPAPLRRR